MILGIDIGGTNIKFSIFDLNFSEKVSFTEKTTAFPSFDDFEKFLLSVKEKFNVKKIGIAAPNANPITNSIHNAPNLHWKGVIPVKEILEKKLGVQVKITNDANAAALGELFFGIGKNFNDFLVITLGTGLGSGIVIEKKIFNGANGFAGELGHTTIFPDGRKCTCGRLGCFEAYVSKRGILQTFYHLGGDTKISDVAKITELAKNNHPLAKKTFNLTGKYLAMGLVNYIHLFDPQAIIFYGGIANAFDLFLNSLKTNLQNSLLPNFKNVKILKSNLKNAAQMGAIALFSEV